MAEGSKSPQRRLSASERRTALLDAGLRLFSVRGYGSTSVGDVASEAGVTKPVLYEHFGSKQELYRSLVEREATRLAQAVLARFDGGEPLEARLRTLAAEAVGFAREHPDSARLLLQLPLGDAGVMTAHERARGQAHRLIAAAILEDPLFRPSPGLSKEASATLLAELQTAVLERLVAWAIEHPEIGGDHLDEVFVDVLWKGLSETD